MAVTVLLRQFNPLSKSNRPIQFLQKSATHLLQTNHLIRSFLHQSVVNNRSQNKVMSCDTIALGPLRAKRVAQSFDLRLFLPSGQVAFGAFKSRASSAGQNWFTSVSHCLPGLFKLALHECRHSKTTATAFLARNLGAKSRVTWRGATSGVLLTRGCCLFGVKIRFSAQGGEIAVSVSPHVALRFK